MASRGRGIVSIHKMKRYFCDGCIGSMLEANRDALMPELIIYDALAQAFYPIGDGKSFQIGDYLLNVELWEWDTYRIHTVYMGAEATGQKDVRQ